MQSSCEDPFVGQQKYASQRRFSSNKFEVDFEYSQPAEFELEQIIYARITFVHLVLTVHYDSRNVYSPISSMKLESLVA
jgi:hypothetical protein